MNKQELWDAVDRQGNPLGYDLIRGEPIPDGVYHHVVMIFTLTDRGNVLITQRHPSKPYGLYWEITGGSAVKGEPPLMAAVRELTEETGLSLSPADFHHLFTNAWAGNPALYHYYMVKVPEDGFSVILQEGETVGWKLVSYEELKRMVHTVKLPMLPAHFCRRFLDYESVLDAAVAALL